MINFFKKLFGKRPTVSPCPEAPYKVETPVVEKPAPSPTKVAPAKKQGGQKPRKQGGAKPKAPRKPKAPKA